MTNDNDLRKKAMLDQMDGELPGGMPGSIGSPNTGIGGAPDVSQIAGPALDPKTGPVGPAPAPIGSPAPQSWSPGAKAGQQVTLLGFDRDKLEDPNSGSVAGSKYTPAAKAFYNGLKQDVGLSRGGLDNMLNYLKANGFENATSDGHQKIDFGDGNGLVDVIRSDGQIVFQNTSGNPTWEGKGYKPDNGGEVQVELPQGGGGGLAPFGGVSLDGALSGDPLAKIQQAIAQMSGAKPNLDALLAQLGS